MNLPDFYIELENVRFHARHGVMKQERITGNEFEVNLKVKTDFASALESDNLDNTISYADIYDVIKTEMMKPSDLIEHVAGRILKRLIENWPQLDSIYLKVSKLNPPIPGEVAKASVVLDWKK